MGCCHSVEVATESGLPFIGWKAKNKVSFSTELIHDQFDLPLSDAVSRSHSFGSNICKVPSEKHEYANNGPTDSAILVSMHSSLKEGVSFKSKWKSLEKINVVRQKYITEGSIPADACNDMVELRLFMEETTLLQSMLQFSNKNSRSHSPVVAFIACWIDIQYFKSLETDGFEHRQCTALHVLDKYLRGSSKHSLNYHDAEKKVALLENILKEESEGALKCSVFVEVELHCFLNIHKEGWVDYRKSKEYESAVSTFKNFNQVTVEDFGFLEPLGKGGFGFVVHAQKKTTKKHYAVKVQKKTDLLQSYSGCLHRVCVERLAITKCNHPFIVGLDYALQTEELLLMAMELGKNGTLRDALNDCPKKMMLNDRVCFYAAEIVLALSHMHQMGFLYRDLKPSNVLLMGDGHIKLVDMGGVVDPQERVLNTTGTVVELLDTVCLPVSREPETDSQRLGVSAVQHQPIKESPRAHTITGTHGYLAPELLRLFNEGDKGNTRGYSKSVDWWALGITMVELLTGKNPLKNATPEEFFDRMYTPTVYIRMFNELRRDNQLSPATIAVLSGFLTIDANKRLGEGHDGPAKIRKQPYFEHINWKLLGQLQVVPPLVPSDPVEDFEVVEWNSFETVVNNAGKRYRLRDFLTSQENMAFSGWDYVAPSAVKLELGVEQL